MRYFIIFSVFLFVISCVTVKDKKNEGKGVFLNPEGEMVPVLLQGFVMGEEVDNDNSLITYPLRDVRVSVSKIESSDAITVATLSAGKGFFSISPDYISGRDKSKYKYLVRFEKPGYQTVTKLYLLPSEEASRINVVLKRVR
jgi:hypothetical protein